MKKMKLFIFGIVVGLDKFWEEIKLALAISIILKFLFQEYSLTMCCVVTLLFAMFFHNTRKAFKNIYKETYKFGNYCWIAGLLTYIFAWLSIMYEIAIRAFVTPIAIMVVLVLVKFVIFVIFDDKDVCVF